MIYEEADRAIRDMNRHNLRRFTGLRLAKFDEIHVIHSVQNVWEESIEYAKRRYREIAVWAYAEAQRRAGIDKTEAVRNARRKIDPDWILDFLEEIDPVTMYRFLSEAERKMYRLIEAATVSPSPNREVEKSLRAWAKQLAQYAIDIVDAATIAGYKDAGVPKLMWNTEKDERVCEDCKPLDGQIFDIDKYPDKPHWNCRCWPSPVFD